MRLSNGMPKPENVLKLHPDYFRRNVVILKRELWIKRKGKHHRERRREIREELKQWQTMLAAATLSQ